MHRKKECKKVGSLNGGERIFEQRVLPSLWPDGAGYGMDRVLKGTDMPSVWSERGAYGTGRYTNLAGEGDLGWQAQGAEAGASLGTANQPARWEISRVLAHLQHWAHCLWGRAVLRA